MIDRYDALNNSFEKTLIFRFGDQAGFFSELNNLILAVLYCLDSRIRCALYTSQVSPAIHWNDYFQPFCEQTTSRTHRIHNKRSMSGRPSLVPRVMRTWMKRTEGFDYFTYEIWDKFRSQEFARRRFSIPALEIDGSILDATRMLIGIIVRYQQSVAEQISDVIASLDLPDEYVGLHIRGGDKTREAKVFSADEYMALLARHTRVRNVFVMTDDFGHIEHLRRRYADYAFFTTCRADERGYDLASFQRREHDARHSEYVKLLASMDVLRAATVAFGSYRTNPGMFLGMCMGTGFIGIDSDEWVLW